MECRTVEGELDTPSRYGAPENIDTKVWLHYSTKNLQDQTC